VDAEKTTLVDAAADFEGKLTGKDARIQGRFKGDIQLTGKLHLVEGCKVDAKMKADAIEIAGEFQGELTARTLVLLEKAKVSGTVTAQALAVREGAQLNGAVQAGKTTTLAAVPAPPATVAAG
jgi:cytoskeletal protein CcmA (bactofilin family)